MRGSNGWAPQVPLGEVVRHRKEFIEIDDFSLYKRCRVQLHAKGVLLRDEVEGAAIKTKKQQVCRREELVVAEIDAKMGGFGIVPEELDGAIVSSHYFLFDPIRDRLDPQFLGYYCRTPAFRDQVTARGTTNYAAIRPAHVLEYTVPLPPLAEQKQIVAKINRLAGKIDEARILREQCSAMHDALFASRIHALFGKAQCKQVTIEEAVGRSQLKNGKSVKSAPSGDGVHCLRLSALADGKIDMTDAKPVPMSLDQAARYLINDGDVFVMRGNGSKTLVGQAAIASGANGKTIFPDLLIRIPLANTGWIPEFFVAVWNSPMMRGVIEDAAKTTSGIWKINQGHIASMALPMPSKEEQTNLLKQLGGIQTFHSSTTTLTLKQRPAITALLPSLFDRAFRGEL